MWGRSFFSYFLSFPFLPFLTFPFLSFSFLRMQVHPDQAYNVFLDQASEFVSAYKEEAVGNDDAFVVVATHIVDMLTRNLHLPKIDPLHPFNRYGQIDDDDGEYGNINRMGNDIMIEIQEQHLRNTVVSFFHSNGAGRGDVEDLLEYFWDFSLACEVIVEPVLVEPLQHENNDVIVIDGDDQ
jgi:hypothetical protein